MSLLPFPAESRMRWRRFDLPGREEARVEHTSAGWRLIGFTPATNTLPIRRLDLAVGETRPVRSAWLRFPELRLEPLEQTCTRETAQSFRYRGDRRRRTFEARLDTDAFGRVLMYEGFWEAELPGSSMSAQRHT
jgi:hypothetical protein